MKLSESQKALLIEASHRWLNTSGRRLCDAWMGFGSATTYKPATRAGLMRPLGASRPGHSTWWLLTAKGAAIVQTWLDNGLSRDHFSKDGILSAGGFAIIDGPPLEFITLDCGAVLTGTDGAGSIHLGDLLDGHPEMDEYCAAVDGALSLILAHYCAGVDVTATQYQDGIATTLDAIANQY